MHWVDSCGEFHTSKVVDLYYLSAHTSIDKLDKLELEIVDKLMENIFPLDTSIGFVMKVDMSQTDRVVIEAGFKPKIFMKYHRYRDEYPMERLFVTQSLGSKQLKSKQVTRWDGRINWELLRYRAITNTTARTRLSDEVLLEFSIALDLVRESEDNYQLMKHLYNPDCRREQYDILVEICPSLES